MDPIGALITFVGCGPGNEIVAQSCSTLSFIRNSSRFALLGYCFCKDNHKKEVDARPQFFSSIQDLCPRGELSRCRSSHFSRVHQTLISICILPHFRCLCKDGRTKARAPFDVMKAYACQPKKVITTHINDDNRLTRPHDSSANVMEATK